MSYLPIEHHGVIGDLHTAALVGTDGTIDWLCLPYFDSPSIFVSILDSRPGGHCRIAAVNPEARRRQMYLPDTNVLLTRFLTPDGVGEVVDFMPVNRCRGEGDRRPPGRSPRARSAGRHPVPHGVLSGVRLRPGARTAAPRRSGFRFTPSGSRPLDVLTTLDCRLEGDGLVADFLLHEGQEVPVVISQPGEENGRRAPRSRTSARRNSARRCASGRSGSPAPAIRAGGGKWSSARP